MAKWTPPDYFKGKRWRCWFCGGDLSQGEKTTYMEGIIYTDPETQLGPIIGPVFVHEKCYWDAFEDNRHLLKQFFAY